MSSILKALKKVQNESPGRHEFRPWPRQFYVKETFPKRLGRLFFSRLFLFSAIVLVLAVAFGWHVFNKKERLPVQILNLPDIYSAPAYDAEKKEAPKTLVVLKPEAFEPDVIEDAPRSFPEKNFDDSRVPARPYESETETTPAGPDDRNHGENIMELNDPGITLQAIIWANNPKDRVAVINGGFMGEGNMVEEFRITAILRANVLLRDNNNKAWRLVYRAR